MSAMRPGSDEKRRPGRTTIANAFRVALHGVRYAVRTQRNLQIHLAIGGLVVFAGWLCRLDRMEWCLVVLCIGLTWTAELLNTSVEVLVDLLSPEYHEGARVAKDVAAAGVLCASGASAVVGALVFGARLLR